MQSPRSYESHIFCINAADMCLEVFKKKKRDNRVKGTTSRLELTLFSLGIRNNLSWHRTMHCSEGFISSGFEWDLVSHPSDKGEKGKRPRKMEKGMYGTDKKKAGGKDILQSRKNNKRVEKKNL